MSSFAKRAVSPFTPQERDLIRLEMGMRFGQYPELANGLFLRTWRAGPQQGKPKIPKAIQSMLDRGLVEVRLNPMGRQAAFFTDAGLEALRQLLQDRRAMDPERSVCSPAPGARNGRSVGQRDLKRPSVVRGGPAYLEVALPAHGST
jgi:hypothetical protein